MTYTYNPYLVVISALIAFLASYTALELAGRVTGAQGIERKIWLVGGATAMGTGIWSMHFLAMLAFSLPVSIGYNFLIVLVSLLAAIVASGQGLFIISRPRVDLSALLLSATFMGIGIGAMHYIGMAAMQMAATIHYDPILFLLSVVIAVVTSLVALKLFLKFRQPSGIGMRRKQPQIISAIVMGSAILLLHYTGMAAATFKQDFERYVEPSSMDNTSMAFLIASFTFLILGATLVIAADKADARDFSA
jgi:NO-binding membrane sensor protein with MHYT domain